MKRVRIYYRTFKGQPVADEEPQLKAAAQGFRCHGLVPEFVNCGGHWHRNENTPEGVGLACDLAVSFGWKHFRNELALGKRSLVLEFGYVGDRLNWTAVGFDAWGGRADFRNKDMPGDRWNKYFADFMQPWRGTPGNPGTVPGAYDGDYVLILGQVMGDADLDGVNLKREYKRMIRALKADGHEVAFRAHPLTPGRDDMASVMRDAGCIAPGIRCKECGREKDQGTLADCIWPAKWTISWNSNASVDSVLGGIPAVTMHEGGMAYPVAGHDPRVPPPMPDRTQWAYDLAYAQWTIEEIARGEAWDHLKPGMDEIW